MGRRRNFSPWFQVVSRLSATTDDDGLPEDPAAFEEWRRRFGSRLEGALAPWPDPVPPDVEETDETDCAGFVRKRIVFDTEELMSVPAFLLVPDGREGRGPAVLCVHGHGAGKSLICGLEPDAAGGGEYAAELARRGHVVLAPDLRCFGERADWNPPDHYGCDTNLVHQIMGGWNPLTQNLWDLARALDVLSAHPLVDPSRIGVCGFSYGGTASLFLAAVDPRPAAVVVSGYLSSWAASHRVPWNLCGSQVLPAMLGSMEHVDLGALVAPRPLLVESGRGDLLFPLPAAEASIARLRVLYDHLGAGDRLVHHVFDGEHRWDGAAAYPFLDRWLAASGHPGGRRPAESPSR